MYSFGNISSLATELGVAFRTFTKSSLNCSSGSGGVDGVGVMGGSGYVGAGGGSMGVRCVWVWGGRGEGEEVGEGGVRS